MRRARVRFPTAYEYEWTKRTQCVAFIVSGPSSALAAPAPVTSSTSYSPEPDRGRSLAEPLLPVLRSFQGHIRRKKLLRISRKSEPKISCGATDWLFGCILEWPRRESYLEQPRLMNGCPRGHGNWNNMHSDERSCSATFSPCDSSGSRASSPTVSKRVATGCSLAVVEVAPSSGSVGSHATRARASLKRALSPLSVEEAMERGAQQSAPKN